MLRRHRYFFLLCVRLLCVHGEWERHLTAAIQEMLEQLRPEMPDEISAKSTGNETVPDSSSKIVPIHVISTIEGNTQSHG